MKGDLLLFDALLRARMGAKDEPAVVGLCDRVESRDKALERAGQIEVFFAMSADDEVATLLQAQASEDVRGHDLRHRMVEDFEHWTPGLDHPIGREALTQKIFA